MRTAHTLRRDWRFHAGYGLLAEKRRYLLHSHAFFGEDDPGVFVAAGFVGDDVARDGAGGSCPDGGVAALAALVLAVARCRYFGKLVGGAVAY